MKVEGATMAVELKNFRTRVADKRIAEALKNDVLQERALTVESCDGRERDFRDFLQRAIDALDKQIARLRDLRATRDASIVESRLCALEAAAREIVLAIIRRLKILHLQRAIGRDAEGQRRDVIAAFDTAAIALATEIRPQLIAERCAVGREPIVAEAEGRRAIKRSRAGDGVNAGL